MIVIPARYASSRFPGKPLEPLTGASGISKTLLQRSWDAARSSSRASRIVVATDDERIRSTAIAFGAEVVMTPASCANGTERCAAALDVLGSGFEIVVNLQGDSPLTPPSVIDALFDALSGDRSQVGVATPVLRCDGEDLRRDRQEGRVGATTAVFNRSREALYFSKEVLPFAAASIHHHLGVYAYRRQALHAYRGLPAGELEKAEGLEQLRFLENGIPILCVDAELEGRPFWELNNPSDVAIIERMLSEAGIN